MMNICNNPPYQHPLVCVVHNWHIIFTEKHILRNIPHEFWILQKSLFWFCPYCVHLFNRQSWSSGRLNCLNIHDNITVIRECCATRQCETMFKVFWQFLYTVFLSSRSSPSFSWRYVSSRIIGIEQTVFRFVSCNPQEWIIFSQKRVEPLCGRVSASKISYSCTSATSVTRSPSSIGKISATIG